MFELTVLALTVLPYFGFLAFMDYSKIKHRYEMSVTLPAASVIKERLCEAQYSDFVEKTKIDTQLASKKFYPYDVEATVRNNLTAYNYSCKGMPIWFAMVNADDTQKITEIILKDNPAAIAKLKTDEELESMKVGQSQKHQLGSL